MPDLRIIKVYPTPENAQILQYQDKPRTVFLLRKRSFLSKQ